VSRQVEKKEKKKRLGLLNFSLEILFSHPDFVVIFMKKKNFFASYLFFVSSFGPFYMYLVVNLGGSPVKWVFCPTIAECVLSVVIIDKPRRRKKKRSPAPILIIYNY
jgi:hypothetical protein